MKEIIDFLSNNYPNRTSSNSTFTKTEVIDLLEKYDRSLRRKDKIKTIADDIGYKQMWKNLQKGLKGV